jgi:hypothetical protein
LLCSFQYQYPHMPNQWLACFPPLPSYLP